MGSYFRLRPRAWDEGLLEEMKGVTVRHPGYHIHGLLGRAAVFLHARVKERGEDVFNARILDLRVGARVNMPVEKAAQPLDAAKHRVAEPDGAPDFVKKAAKKSSKRHGTTGSMPIFSAQIMWCISGVFCFVVI